MTIRNLGNRLCPNPPMDKDGRRKDTGRGVRELQGRRPGLHWCRWGSADGLQSPHGGPLWPSAGVAMRGMAREYAAGNSRGPGWREFPGTLGQLQAGSGMACSRAMARRVSGSAGVSPSGFLPSPDGRPLLMAGRGVVVSVGNIAAGDTQTPDVSDGFLIGVWRCIPTGGSAGTLPVQGGSDRICQSVLTPPNSGVESHRPVRVLDDVRSGRSAGQELQPTHSGAVADRAVVQCLQGRLDVVAGITVGMTAVAVAPAAAS